VKKNFLIIGDSKGRRIETFAACLKETENVSCLVLDWMTLLEEPDILEKFLKESNIVKIEPPEKNTEIYERFLKYGRGFEKIIFESSRSSVKNSEIIKSPKVWFDGIKNVFGRMSKIFENHKNVYLMCDIKETLIMMDKKDTYEYLSGYEKSFFLPERTKEFRNYDEFFEACKNKAVRYFIKLRCGSGSTGVLAYSYNPRLDEEKIYTSLNYSEENGKRDFFSTYKVKIYTEKKIIKNMINWVIENGAHIEKWLPKLTYKEYGFDTRVFVAGKKAEYMLSRLSTTPVTNLHLRNMRKESSEFMEKEQIKLLKTASEDVMEIFNKSLYAGIDVLLSNNLKPYIIDVNPFGDLFHNLINSDKNVYYSEIKKALEELEIKEQNQ
jgi:hypothetical protein